MAASLSCGQRRSGSHSDSLPSLIRIIVAAVSDSFSVWRTPHPCRNLRARPMLPGARAPPAPPPRRRGMPLAQSLKNIVYHRALRILRAPSARREPVVPFPADDAWGALMQKQPKLSRILRVCPAYCIISCDEILSDLYSTKCPDVRKRETDTDETRTLETLEAPTYETDDQPAVNLRNVLVTDISRCPPGGPRPRKISRIVFHREILYKLRSSRYNKSLWLRHSAGGVETFHE
ncbi:hypothetical protein EVAR_3313_1 [Eumeta japonica]|uniref:Uncharacterized protein n=1 Tax=Eumeta variegata TaxID=151549 RepID=A0A4C1SW01_EUMVA|nr:hypothetical protein EVAR_3313_1 [Eumeta japonica]